MSVDTTSDIKHHVKTYLMVFVTLAFLTLVTVGVSFLDLSTTNAIILALAIASVKGALVASYFMHLITEKAFIVWILFLTVLFFFVIIFMPVLANYDWIDIS